MDEVVIVSEDEIVEFILHNSKLTKEVITEVLILEQAYLESIGLIWKDIRMI